MALIRQSIARTMARDAIVLDLGDLTRQAEQIKSRALAEAERILGQARAEREQILAGAAEAGQREGFTRGVEEGRIQGIAEGRAAAMAETGEQLARLDQSWSQALEQFTASRERMLSDMRHDVLRLAVQIGEMVTKQVLGARPEAVVDQLTAVLALLVRPNRLTMAAHPDDLPLLHDALPSLKERFSAAAHVELVADAALDRGSCIARTGSADGSAGEVDASIATQLLRIVEALLPASATGEFPPAGPTSPESNEL